MSGKEVTVLPVPAVFAGSIQLCSMYNSFLKIIMEKGRRRNLGESFS